MAKKKRTTIRTKTAANIGYEAQLGQMADTLRGINRRSLWAESHQITESLHIQDQGGLPVWCHGLASGLQKKSGQSAKLTEVTAPVAEEGPNEL